jgi:cytoskeletal protein CcmA (bactofilin family)
VRNRWKHRSRRIAVATPPADTSVDRARLSPIATETWPGRIMPRLAILSHPKEDVMFSHQTERPDSDDPRASGIRATPATGMRDVEPMPISSEASQSGHAGESVIGREDNFEGTLRTQKSVRVLGKLQGHIEAAKSVYVEEGARVDADVTADEAIIAGQYSGKLVCRQRLEIRSTGLVKGEIETVRLMLHEGGFIDGALHMQRPDSGPGSVRSDAGSVRVENAQRAATVEVVRPTVSSSASSGNSSSRR